MIQFEQTFMNFLFHHQEKFNRTYHFLILMDAVISAAKHIQHYYLTGALKGNLGLAGEVNIQGEEVMRMDQIAHEIVIHYLKTSERVIHAVSEEEELIIRSFRNLQGAKTLLANYLNIRDLLGYDKVIVPVQSLDVIAGYLGK